jgi:hypothetical protein
MSENAQLQTFALLLHLQKPPVPAGETMYLEKPYLLALFACLLCLTSCAKIIEVDVLDIGDGGFIISAREKVWRKGVCIGRVIIQKSGNIIWNAGIDRGSTVCVDRIRYPGVPLGFTVNKNVKIAEAGIYDVSVLSEAGIGGARFEIK